MIEYLPLDPRPDGDRGNFRTQQIEKLRSLRSDGWLLVGFEVTTPALAAEFDFNLDPQHGEGGDAATSCIKAVSRGAYAPVLNEIFQNDRRKIAFATVRPDLDSLGAMAIALILHECQDGDSLEELRDRVPQEVFDRVEAVHDGDIHAAAPTWEPSPEFWTGSPDTPLAIVGRAGSWIPRMTDAGIAAIRASDDGVFVAMHPAVADRTVPLETRVRWMKNWLESGAEPDGYREAARADSEKILTALADGSTRVRVFDIRGFKAPGFAVVESRLPSATGIGYTVAPVLICYNPEFPFTTGEVGLKYSVCQTAPGYADMAKFNRAIAALEPGWGGSPTFQGSPQGTPSKLSLEDVRSALTDSLI